MEYASAESRWKSQMNDLQAQLNDAVNKCRQWEEEYNVSYYRAMLRRARYCYGKLSVCPSVRNVEVL